VGRILRVSDCGACSREAIVSCPAQILYVGPQTYSLFALYFGTDLGELPKSVKAGKF
jgi:hypothetical protein